MILPRLRLLLCAALVTAISFSTLLPSLSTNVAGAEPAALQQQNVVYAEAFGVGLIMDIFTPTGKKNGLAVVDVISGAWDSSRGKIRDHERAQIFETLCSRGYTVFAVRPGSVSKFSIPEMVTHIEKGIVWIKQHASDYGISADRIGLTGASAGGHLASLVAVKNGCSDVHSDSNQASVKAIGVFFPPTDLLEFSGQSADPASKKEVSAVARRIAFPSGVGELTDEQIRQQLIEISPARRVTKETPPFLLIHGSADNVVPLEHSKKMQRALEDKGVPVELIIKEGGGHPWLTIHEEVIVLADWFDKHLGG